MEMIKILICPYLFTELFKNVFLYFIFSNLQKWLYKHWTRNSRVNRDRSISIPTSTKASKQETSNEASAPKNSTKKLYTGMPRIVQKRS